MTPTPALPHLFATPAATAAQGQRDRTASSAQTQSHPGAFAGWLNRAAGPPPAAPTPPTAARKPPMALKPPMPHAPAPVKPRERMTAERSNPERAPASAAASTDRVADDDAEADKRRAGAGRADRDAETPWWQPAPTPVAATEAEQRVTGGRSGPGNDDRAAADDPALDRAEADERRTTLATLGDAAAAAAAAGGTEAAGSTQGAPWDPNRTRLPAGHAGTGAGTTAATLAGHDRAATAADAVQSAAADRAVAQLAIVEDRRLLSSATGDGRPIAEATIDTRPDGEAAGVGVAALLPGVVGSAPAGAASTLHGLPTRLSAGPGSAEFATQLGASITTFLRQGVQQARLDLNPSEMGPLTVQIQLDGARAQVHLLADHAGTRQALEQAMPQLAGSLREAGLTLTGGGVSDHPRQPPATPDGDPGASRGPGDRRNDDSALTQGSGPVSGAVATQPGRRGVVDLIA